MGMQTEKIKAASATGLPRPERAIIRETNEDA
jgi:hypothetical protein